MHICLCLRRLSERRARDIQGSLCIHSSVGLDLLFDEQRAVQQPTQWHNSVEHRDARQSSIPVRSCGPCSLLMKRVDTIESSLSLSFSLSLSLTLLWGLFLAAPCSRINSREPFHRSLELSPIFSTCTMLPQSRLPIAVMILPSHSISISLSLSLSLSPLIAHSSI